MLFQVLLLAAPVWTLYSAICLLTNYLKARTLKVPMIIVPISGTNVPWVLLEPRLWPLIKHLPFSLADRFYYMRREWTFYDKHKTHERLGDYFVKVTPGQNMLYVSNGDVVNEIFARHKDFTRPVHFYRELSHNSVSVALLKLSRSLGHFRKECCHCKTAHMSHEQGLIQPKGRGYRLATAPESHCSSFQ